MFAGFHRGGSCQSLSDFRLGYVDGIGEAAPSGSPTASRLTRRVPHRPKAWQPVASSIHVPTPLEERFTVCPDVWGVMLRRTEETIDVLGRRTPPSRRPSRWIVGMTWPLQPCLSCALRSPSIRAVRITCRHRFRTPRSGLVCPTLACGKKPYGSKSVYHYRRRLPSDGALSDCHQRLRLGYRVDSFAWEFDDTLASDAFPHSWRHPVMASR